MVNYFSPNLFDLYLFYLCLFVDKMFIAEFTILFKFYLVWSFSFVFGRCIIFSLAFSTGKSNKYSIHFKPLDVYIDITKAA